MDSGKYSERFTRQRRSRRQVIGGAMSLAAAAAAASLVSCGGNDGGGGGESGDSSGLLAPIQDTTSQAKRGGTYRAWAASDVPTWDPIERQSASAGIPTDAYLTLVERKLGVLEPGDDGEIEALIAESWEFFDGGTRLVMKLRKDARFDPRPPTNGRAVEAADVLWTWEKFKALSNNRARLANSANKAAPLESIRAIDSQTIELKLAFPDAEFFQGLRFLPVMPREAEDQFNPKSEMRGTGPYMVTDYQPSVGATFSLVPDHFQKDRWFPEKREYPIISENAAGMAQFRAGNVYHFPVAREEILRTKEDIPDLSMYLEKRVSALNGHMPLGWLEGSPFRDQRMRQALTMAVDDETFSDAFFETANFKARGLPVEFYPNSPFLTAANTGLYLDPTSPAFGPNSKYMKYDPEEAKKLIAAAGFPNGVDVPTHYFTTSQYTLVFPKYIEAVLGMFREVGIRAVPNILNYQSEWLPRIFSGRGKFVGMSFTLQASTEASILPLQYVREGARYYGFDIDGRDPEAGDPALEDMIRKQQVELDRERRVAAIADIQRYLAEKQYYPRFIPGYASSFKLAWPIVRNAMVRQLASAGDSFDLSHIWLDPTRAPGNSA